MATEVDGTMKLTVTAYLKLAEPRTSFASSWTDSNLEMKIFTLSIGI